MKNLGKRPALFEEEKKRQFRKKKTPIHLLLSSKIATMEFHFAL